MLKKDCDNKKLMGKCEKINRMGENVMERLWQKLVWQKMFMKCPGCSLQVCSSVQSKWRLTRQI